jgi:hypothetical protein
MIQTQQISHQRNQTKEIILKKLELLSEINKVKRFFEKESDKLDEVKAKMKDQKEIANIKQTLIQK